jgi:hypothetical protein
MELNSLEKKLLIKTILDSTGITFLLLSLEVWGAKIGSRLDTMSVYFHDSRALVGNPIWANLSKAGSLDFQF